MAKRKNLSKRSLKGSARAPSGERSGTWLYGVHTVAAALANPRRRFRRIVIAAQAGREIEARLGEAAAASGADRPKPEIRDRRELEALLGKDAVHQGAAALAEPLPEIALEDVCRDAADTAAALVVVLDQASDPRNVGAVLRSAAAFGAVAVIVQDRRSPEATAALAKAAAGALEITPLVRVTNISRAMETLKDHGFWCVGLDAGAERPLAGARIDGKAALVLGSEGGGLRRLTAQCCDLLVKVPIAGGIDSLNLSNAAAIALYELRR